MKKKISGKTVAWFVFEMPALFALMVAGYLVDFFVTLPMMIDCELELIRKNGGIRNRLFGKSPIMESQITTRTKTKKEGSMP